MGESWKLEEFKSEHSKEIEYIRKLGCRAAYNTVLSSNIIYLIILSKQFQDKRIFNSLSKKFIRALLLFKDENPGDCSKVYGIMKSLLENNCFQETLYWLMCYTYIENSALDPFGKFISKQMEGRIPKDQRGVQLNDMEKSIIAFSNFFHVKIDLIQLHDEVKSCFPENLPPKTKIPIIFLVKFEKYYGMGFTKLMKKIEDEKYNKNLQIKFLNFIYFYKTPKEALKSVEVIKINYPPCVPIGGSLTSQRTHISKLPLNEVIIKELKCNYLHCYAITEKYNQVSALALALKLAIESGSNGEYFMKMSQNFQHGKSMCNLTFNNSFYFKQATHEQLIEYAKNIYQTALQKPRDLGPGFDYIAEGAEFMIENSFSRDFNFIEILSRVLGVTSLIIICENTCRVILYNGSPNDFRPTLHFLALKEGYETFRMYVLLTREYCFENKYDFKTGSSEIRNKILNKALCDYKINLEAQKEDKSPHNYRFLIEASNIQNKIISDVMDNVKANKPISLDKSYFQAKCLTLRTLESTVDIQFLTQNGLNKLRIINESIEDLNQTCHYCNCPIGENDFKGASCFYHNKCIVTVYFNYYRSIKSNEKKTIDQVTIVCPTCQSRIMNLSEFLEKDYGKEYEASAREYYNNEVFCSHCKHFINIETFVNISHTNGNCPENYCIDCAINKFTIGNCRNCVCGGQINLDASQLKFLCAFCKAVIIIEDLIQIKLEGGFACKKCWIVSILNGSASSITTQQDLISLYQIFQNDCVQCISCNKVSFKHYNKDFGCTSLHTELICYECFISSNNMCILCGEQFVYFNQI